MNEDYDDLISSIINVVENDNHIHTLETYEDKLAYFQRQLKTTKETK